MPGPFTRSYTKQLTLASGHNITQEQLNQVWYTSARVDGKLDLRPQVFSRTFTRLYSAHQYIPPSGSYAIPVFTQALASENGSEATAMRQTCYNQAYSRLWSRIRGSDTAGIGIGLAQWRQTWSMVANNYRRINRHISFVKKRTSSGTHRGERFADLLLETQFGWVPFLSDSWTLVRELAGWNSDFAAKYYKGTATQVAQVPDLTVSASERYFARYLQVRATVSLRAEVSNPNLWIANRMGLVNPAAIVWDAIPWSFLVGMFANINSYIGSFTNDYGLAITDASTTYTTKSVGAIWVSNGYPKTHPFYADASASGEKRVKSRDVSGVSLPRPQLQVVLPRLDWGLALIGSSLAYQQISNLGPKGPYNHRRK